LGTFKRNLFAAAFYVVEMFSRYLALKVVTNEKGEAVGEVVTIICLWGRWCWMFFVILMGCHLV
jgi:hypothetical protein